MEESLEGHREDIVVVAGEAWRQVWKGTDIYMIPLAYCQSKLDVL